MKEEELNINLTKRQKRKIWDIVMVVILIIGVYLLISASFRAGSIYVCDKMGADLQLKPEYKCWFEDEERTRQERWAALFNMSGGG